MSIQYKPRKLNPSMPLFLRRIIFYLLLLFFLVVAPIILGYTAGYRYSFKQRRIIQIGALSVTTIPEDAHIILNNNDTSRSSPALISDLEPGNYTIRLEKDGYFSWQKSLPVVSEKTTFAHNVLLFKSKPPTLLPEVNSDIFKNSLQGVQSFKNFMVLYDEKLDKIVVIDNLLKKRIVELPGKFAVWRKNDTPLLFTYSNHEIWQFNPSNYQNKLVNRLLEDIESVIPLPNHDVVILAFKDRVRALELDTRDNQNSWDLATFEEIKNTSLAEDGKALFIEGRREGKSGNFKLELY